MSFSQYDGGLSTMPDKFRDTVRLIASMFIWAVIGLIPLLSLAIAEEIAAPVAWITLFGMAFAYAATRQIWNLGGEEDEKKQSGDYAGKRKRGSGDTKADMLLALMDDDEREAFKEALKQRMLDSSARLSDDGEIESEFDVTSLEALLREDRER
jgi:hypothetical protein